MAMKPHSKFPISSAKSHVGMLFKDISPSPHESELRFHLIQFSSTNRRWLRKMKAKTGQMN
ncbi:unnamed protein product [Brassica napus]|uniref:(rape) hypothetical protein n=1 Tax=Brassica napus TaxID=3708 RepID=A0A816PAQ5_BRANA|nr:unnamed protein product [Brassica napus]